jgi:hypothetical protein
MKRKRFYSNIGDWDVEPSWGKYRSWQCDARVFIRDAEKIVKAIRFNVKLCKKALKLKRKDMEDFWDYQSK